MRSLGLSFRTSCRNSRSRGAKTWRLMPFSSTATIAPPIPCPTCMLIGHDRTTSGRSSMGPCGDQVVCATMGIPVNSTNIPSPAATRIDTPTNRARPNDTPVRVGRSSIPGRGACARSLGAALSVIGFVATQRNHRRPQTMRIALFTETFVPKIDGIVTTLSETVRQLKSLGHEVLVFAPDGGVADFEGTPIVGMKGRSFALYPELRLSLPRASMRGHLRAFKPDLLHVADPTLLGIAALYYGGGANGGALHLPLVISYHTDLPAYLHYYKLGFVEPHIWRIMRIRHNRATLNLCTSVAMMEQLHQHGIGRVALWPGGVDTSRFHPDRRSQAMRARLTEGHPES